MNLFTHYTIETAPEGSKALLQGVQQGYGFVPNLFKPMAEAPTSIEAYLNLNQIIDKGTLTPVEAQVALLTVSVENNCGFCSVAHQAVGKMKGANLDDLKAIANHQPLDNPKLQALVTFTQHMVRERGFVSEQVVKDFLDAGFTKAQVFEVIIIIAIKTLSNYSNHLTNPEPNAELVGAIA